MRISDWSSDVCSSDLQATNQLLALVAKQQFQIQNLMAAQYRAESVDAARQAQNTLDARKAGVVATLDTRGATKPHALTPPHSPYLLSAATALTAVLIPGLPPEDRKIFV